MENTHRFFNNRACKYFPCHAGPDPGSFNCMFCYCPLYFLGERCGGQFKYSGEEGIKNCDDCFFPHMPEYYETIVAKLAKKENLITETTAGEKSPR